jgi:hypothetical protein
VALVAVAVALGSGCDSGGSDATTTGDPATTEASPTTTTQAPGDTTTQAPGDTTTSTPVTTTTTAAPPRLPATTTTTLAPPPLPDAFELAADALRAIDGFQYTDDDLTLRELDELEFRIGALLGTVLEEYSWSRMESSSGDELVVASLYPRAGYRADPELDFAVAFSASGFEDPEPVDIAGYAGWRINVGQASWTFAGDNTHVFLAIGEAEPVAAAIAALLEANAPGYLWQEGDCLYLGREGVPYAPFGDGELVPCDGAHTHEVIWSTTLDAGPGAPFPDQALADQSYEACEVAFEAYTGAPEFPSEIAMVRYLPDGEEWREGDRYLACVVYLGDDASAPVAIDETVEGRGPDLQRAVTPGECADVAGGSSVRCSRPHTFEYVGVAQLDLSAATYPGASAVETAASEGCSLALDGFATRTAVGDVSLEAFAVWFPGPAAWERGDRFAHCMAWAIDGDDELQLVMGSIAEDWEPVRPPRDGGIDA